MDGDIANKQSSYKSDTPRQIAHQNWKFVEQLLKETKSEHAVAQFNIAIVLDILISI